MIYNIMTWNTQLYEQGNKLYAGGKTKVKNSECFNKVFDTIISHLDNGNAIAVLQEIPYVSNETWAEHKIFTAFKNKFSDKVYDVFYNVFSNKQLKMTVVIAKKNIIMKDGNEINRNNCFVGFKIKETDLKILAVHSHDAFELGEWLSSNESYSPQMMLGDFNAGNYKKKNKDCEIAVNRKNYLMVCEGYIDIFQGCYTTIYKTHIDHVLIENSNEFHNVCCSKNITVDYSNNLSDHYPLYFQLEYHE